MNYKIPQNCHCERASRRVKQSHQTRDCFVAHCGSLLAMTILFTLILAGLFTANFVFAIESPSIVINEITWMGSEVDSIESKNWWRYEWIELYNNTEQLISIDDWKIELYRDKLDYTIELSGNIKPKNYFLIVASDKIAHYDLNYSNLTGKFVNSGQKILLKNAQGKIIEQIDCSMGWFTGDNKTKQTMEKIDANLSENNPQNWQTSQNPGGTPKSQNSIITKTDKTEKIEQAIETETKNNEKNGEDGPSQIYDKKGLSPTLTQIDRDPVSVNSTQSTQYPLSSILIASITAVFSGVIIILLKNKSK